MPDLLTVAHDALRWVSGLAVPEDGGLSWREQDDPSDGLYSGTAGVLLGFAEAKLTGVDDFDHTAGAAAGRLRHLAGTAPEPGPGTGVKLAEPGDGSLCDGLAGYGTALRCWHRAAGDRSSGAAATAIADRLAARGPVPTEWRDVLLGEAGVLLYLLAEGGPDAHPAAGRIADRLVAAARPEGDGVDWYARDSIGFYMPNFSHGGAGIGFALARAAEELDRPDLLAVAVAAARRLLELGLRPNGGVLVPHSVPIRIPEFPVSYGWCHGPTGTVRLFAQLARLRPADGWDRYVAGCRQAVRDSGLPARLRPGFWDNLGQCCGTAGVGELALDSYQQTADRHWLDWADELAADVLARAVTDGAGTRWSNTEYTADPPELPPVPGWMQGAAGIAGWLFRLARVHRDGVSAARLEYPDRPPLAG